MSETSPADLAVAFRSIPRRLREAVGDAPHEVVAAPLTELAAVAASAAALLRAPADHAFIADAIDARPAEAWDDATLAELRRLAIEAGRVLRQVASLTGSGEA